MTDKRESLQDDEYALQNITRKRFDTADPHTEDYLGLPELGSFHYSVVDAALLIAIDAWTDGRAKSLTSDELFDAGDPDNPDVRKALAPLVKAHAEVLMRSHIEGMLKAEVRARSWPDLQPDPTRTYVDLSDLREWLEVHQQPIGDYLFETFNNFGEELWDAASEVAHERARFRDPVSLPQSGAGPDASRLLRRQLEDAYRRIAQLEGAGRQSDGARDSERDLSTSPRRTLLAIIAALCRKSGIDPLARGAAVKIAGITEDAGLRVSEDIIRHYLEDMADAIDRRSAVAKPNSGK